jgi:cell division protein FtsI (penicillin-binding protein 3)
MNRHKRKSLPGPPLWRGYFLLVLFAVVAAALELRLGWLQLVNGDFLAAEGAQRQLREVEMPVHRGIVTDRFGEPLAVSTPVDSIVVNPQEIPPERIRELAAAVGLDGAEVERKITARLDKEFLWVARQLPPADAAKVLEHDIPGVSTRREYKRYYPSGEVVCHLVGITDVDDTGREGLEYAYEHQLAGVPGRKLVQRDEKGRLIADIEQIEAPRPGLDLRTSIDLRLQYLAYLELKRAVQNSGASSGSMVILDVTTGEVLTLANQPMCNPNDPKAREDLAKFRNRAVTDPIEPGSTIKPLILAAALDSGYTPDTRVNVPKHLEVLGQRLTSDTTELGVTTVTQILARSSSVGMGIIAGELESADLWQALKNFGIGETTGGDLGDIESPGSLEGYRQWSPVSQATLAYGYGLKVTPLQLARAYTAIASGGLLPQISFKALDAPADRIHAITPEIARDLMAMLEVVVADGTAKRAAIPNYSVAGKTGTVRIHQSGGYSDRYRALFVGIAPASRPRFVAVTVINDPRDDYEGGQIAAPVFAKVIGAALRMYAVAPDALEAERGPATTQVSLAEVPR